MRDVPDFPKPGILFKDITPILGDPAVFRLAIDRFVADCAGLNIEKIAGINARGFLFGATVADRLGLGFVPVRTKGKLPGKTESLAYRLDPRSDQHHVTRAFDDFADGFSLGECLRFSGALF